MVSAMGDAARQLPATTPANDAPARRPVPPEARPFIVALARLLLANALRPPTPEE